MADREMYLTRISSYVKPDFELERKFFKPSDSLMKKFDSNNCFKQYYGDTLVFDLDWEDNFWFNCIVNRLYEEVPECFSARLGEGTLHVTLHDLSSGTDCEKVEQLVKQNRKQIKKVLKLAHISPMKIRMKTRYIANSCNTSLIYVLVPANEKEYLKLMTLYHVFDAVQELDYCYTPHITLGYFNTNGFDVQSVEKLEKIVRELNNDSYEFVLSTDKLFYAIFKSMNEYKYVRKLIK